MCGATAVTEQWLWKICNFTHVCQIIITYLIGQPRRKPICVAVSLWISPFMCCKTVLLFISLSSLYKMYCHSQFSPVALYYQASKQNSETQKLKCSQDTVLVIWCRRQTEGNRVFKLTLLLHLHVICCYCRWCLCGGNIA